MSKSNKKTVATYTPKDVAAAMNVDAKSARRRMRSMGITCGKGKRHILSQKQYDDVIGKNVKPIKSTK